MFLPKSRRLESRALVSSAQSQDERADNTVAAVQRRLLLLARVEVFLLLAAGRQGHPQQHPIGTVPRNTVVNTKYVAVHDGIQSKNSDASRR